MPDIDFGVTKITDHENKGELRIVEQFKTQYGGEPEPPPPPPPVWEQMVWLKAEMNLLDSSGKGHDAEWVDGSPLYGTNCFNIRYKPTYGYLRIPAHEDFSWDPTKKFEVTFNIDLSYYTYKNSELKMMKSSDYTGTDRDFMFYFANDGSNNITFTIITPFSITQSYGIIGTANNKMAIKITYDNGRFELYVNDVLKSPSAYADFSSMENDIRAWCFVDNAYYGKALLDNFIINRWTA